MVQFSVTTPALGYSAAAMSGALAEFDARVAQVSAAVSAVVGASWTGEAADAFTQVWHEWLSDAAVTRSALADIAVRLTAAQSTYEVTEAQVTASARSSSIATETKKVGA